MGCTAVAQSLLRDMRDGSEFKFEPMIPYQE